MPIPDLLQPGLRVVFCGTALGTASERAAAYYAGPGNKFWPTLHAIGFTPRQYRPEEYRLLLGHGIGLTDLSKTRSGTDAELGPGAFDPERLVSCLRRYEPDWIAFNSKRAAKEALGRSAVGYGPQEERLGGVRTFVLPSTSGAASGHWDIARWHELAALLRPG